ncbi:hypothetical protein BCR36DRAFT_281012 [Piromyces finnis]|uniref:Uncharacterized protein n=1 Tax=Piromyces finnis TaxID=1754191 RepID=A0A1Y1VGX4_9FUNG|nr:hypothetical protein BCR36DRAFT_281012 [Piromyces finnis]|eukprot:ORX55959.1 hypothetical protein BCR36DRAFT_281012 [Piromyces finnis]
MNYKPSNSTNIDKQENNIEQIYKLSNLCNENDIYFNSDSDSFKNVMSSQKNITKIQLSNPNNVSGIISIKCCLDPEEMEQNTEEIYPLTDSFLNKVVTFNKENGDISYIADEYSINIPKDMDLEEAFKTLIIENINIRVYSKDIEEELKEVIKTNEMLEKENNEIELKMKKDANSKNEIFNENENMTNQTVTKLNDLKLNMMTILSNYISKLNSINEGIFSDNGIEKYYEAFEDMLNEVTKLNDNISTTLLQNSIEKSIKENIEFEFFKYKNNYSFSVNEYNNRINELKHNIISLKKEKEVLINENKNLKYTNLSIESDIGGSKSVDTRSVNSVLSDNQEIKSLYEVGSESSIKSSKFSKLTNSAKKIIRNTSNKKLFKDKKTRSRGFSVSLPVKRKIFIYIFINLLIIARKKSN